MIAAYNGFARAIFRPPENPKNIVSSLVENITLNCKNV
jgi:hypothetical protein